MGEQEIVPFFSKFRHKYQPVPEGDQKKVHVKPFLAATREVLDLLDLFGRFLKPVKTDINANITTLQAKYDRNPEQFDTFDAMLEHNRQTGEGDAYVALLWLKRALDFLASFVSQLVQDYKDGVHSESLSHLSHRAYEQSLQRYHNFIVRNFSRLLLRLIPSRSSLNKLLCGNPELSDTVVADIEECSRLLSENLHVINELFPPEERN